MKLFLAITSVYILFSCEQKLNDIKFESFTFHTNSQISNKKSSALTEGSELRFSIEKMTVKLSSSYYSDDLYEYDLEIISKDDTARLQNLKENNIAHVVAKRKSEIDLDYYRVYNVFFDTINDLPIKILKPRIPYTNDYKVFVPKIPNTYKKNIGDKSLTIVFQNIKNESDLGVFDEFYKSMTYSLSK